VGAVHQTGQWHQKTDACPWNWPAPQNPDNPVH
jgi:hypothetical protein